MEIEGKVALVTGAAKGIGRATAIALAKEGGSVIINYKSDTKSAQEVWGECNKYSRGNMVWKADVTREDEVEKMMSIIREKFSRLDILVNNAAVFDDKDSPGSLDVFERIFRSNFLSCVTVTKYALGLMEEGKIINVSSIHGRLGHGRADTIAYSSFKAALESYTKNLAKVVAPKILVNAVAPGMVMTPQWGHLSAQRQVELGRRKLIKRMIRPEEVADSLMFLIRNDAMCGEVLTIDGGMSLVTLG